ILCCLLALVLMLAYITIIFELGSGIAAVISLAHNVLVLLAIYSIFQLNINTTFIAAILTIVGYSINDTIVTFDRIREINRKVRKTPFSEIANRGVNKTLTRSINTSVTTLLTIVVLYIVGVTSIKEFALPIIIGIVVGTYSSIFIASPLWAMFKKDDVALSNNKNK
ncbi:MAG: protein translocase subunit SecF, partial [Clostridia bacterium]|nr:protein translocase subunit SecF [Clostridia bacterium]